MINTILTNNLKNNKFNHNKSKSHLEKKWITLKSSTGHEKNIYIEKFLSKGSFNDIYTYSYNDNKDKNNIIRILNDYSDKDIVESELKGIKIQNKLCKKSKLIGQIIDYGIADNKYQYSIIKKYDKSLKDLLNETFVFYSAETIIKFIYNLIKGIYIIHKNNIAHLDIKPENILLYNISYKDKKLFNFNFAIIDFGGSQKFTDDDSKTLDAQMASAQFSPPELLKYKFGRASDVWAIGVIMYLMFKGKNFYGAKANEIFMNENLVNLKYNIDLSLEKLLKTLQKKYNISKNLFDKLLKIFSGIFQVNYNHRITSKELYNIIND